MVEPYSFSFRVDQSAEFFPFLVAELIGFQQVGDEPLGRSVEDQIDQFADHARGGAFAAWSLPTRDSPAARVSGWTSFLSSMTFSMVATVVVAIGRRRRSAVQICPRLQGPACQRICRSSNSPSVG